MSNLLIIDKDRNLCTDVCNFFRSIGYTTQQAHDYQSALLLLEQQNFNYLELGCEVKGLGRGHIKRIKESIRKQ